MRKRAEAGKNMPSGRRGALRLSFSDSEGEGVANISRRARIKKHLGQHFLGSKPLLGAMMRAAELSPKDTVLEVGPGRGGLTLLLASRAKKVIAVEKDRELLPSLRKKFKNQKNVKILEGDILKIHHSKFLIPHSGYKIVANLPYYLTSRFLRLFLSQTGFRPTLMVLMVQKEVARRIVAADGKESLLSLSVKAYAKPKLIRLVPRHFFSPRPKVDSAILKLSNISGFEPKGVPEKKFFNILQRAFRQKRKMLRHSLKNLPLPPSYATKRPEELTLQDWVKLATNL